MSGSGIIPSIGKIQKEISVWETRVAEKEKDASILSIKIQDIKIGLNVFLGKYYSKVGIVYVKLDKLNLSALAHKFGDVFLLLFMQEVQMSDNFV